MWYNLLKAQKLAFCCAGNNINDVNSLRTTGQDGTHVAWLANKTSCNAIRILYTAANQFHTIFIYSPFFTSPASSYSNQVHVNFNGSTSVFLLITRRIQIPTIIQVQFFFFLGATTLFAECFGLPIIFRHFFCIVYLESRIQRV